MAIQLTEKQRTEGWQVVKFGEIGREVKVTTKDPNEDGLEFYIGLEHLDPYSLRITRKGIIADDNPSFTRRFSAGQILFGKRRAYQKKAAIADFDGICSGDIIVIEANPKRVIPGLLPFIVQSDFFFDWAEKTSSGSLSPRTKWKALAKFELPLPPVERQKEILEVLETGEQCALEIDRCIIGILDLKRITISKFYSYKELGGKSQQVRLKDVFDIVSGQVDPTKKPYSNLPHIAPDNISKSTGQMLAFQTAEEDGVTSGKYEFDETWFLYSKIRPNLRKICFPRFRGICSADVYPIRGKNGADTEYLFYLMQSEHFNSYAEANSMRSGFPKINRDDLGAYKFFLPEIKRQKRIVNYLRHYDDIFYTLQSKKKKQIELAMKYIGEALFGGVS